MPSRPLVSLCVIAEGETYQRYAAQFMQDAERFFLPGEQRELVVLRGKTDGRLGGTAWSYTSATRPRVILDSLERIRGEWIFQADADMRILRPVGREILADGVTVTTHPGFPPGDPNHYPYERDPRSSAYVPLGAGTTYHPGAFWGGKREAYIGLASELADRVDADVAAGVSAVWYEESHLNRLLIDVPPALVLDERYCGWEGQTVTAETIIVHLNKTVEEFAARG